MDNTVIVTTPAQLQSIITDAVNANRTGITLTPDFPSARRTVRIRFGIGSNAA